MKEELLSRLTWRGRETVEKVQALLDHSARIEIELPDNYNHALFRALNPNEALAAPETINTTSGPELLAEIASVRGLEELAALIEALNVTQAIVQVISPPKVIITFPAADRTK